MNSSAKIMSLVVSALCLPALGCAPATEDAESRSATVQIANPAAVHCIGKGGRIEIEKDRAGNETGICHLPDGAAIEEWELFRRDNPRSGQAADALPDDTAGDDP